MAVRGRSAKYPWLRAPQWFGLLVQAMADADVRWQQRFSNFQAVLQQLEGFGSRDTLRLAFRRGLIADGEAWMRMIQDRNLTSHTYNRATADQISAQVEATYLGCFQHLRARLLQRLAEHP